MPQTQASGSSGTDAPAPGTVETWTVASSGTFPAVSSSATQPTQIHVSDPALASEIILVTNISGLNWTVTRGAEGTTPLAHQSGFTIKQVVTSGGLAGFGLGQNQWCAPGGYAAETFPRILSSGNQTLGATGTLYVVGVSLPQYFTVTAISMATKTPAAATQTHGWYVILDNALVVRGVTADQTTSGSGGLFGATTTAYPVNLAAPYVTTYTGLYYIGVNISAGTMPSLITSSPMAAALCALAPVFCGSVSTGYSATPPAVTTALSGLTANANYTLYAGLS